MKAAGAAALLLAAGGVAAGVAEPPKERPEPPKVFTNDDLERYRAERGDPPGSPAPGEPAYAGVELDVVDAFAVSPEELDQLRQAIEAAEAARDDARRELEDVEARLNPMSTLFEVDPNRILELQGRLPEARAQLELRTAAVQQARDELAAAEERTRRRVPPRPSGDH